MCMQLTLTCFKPISSNFSKWYGVTLAQGSMRQPCLPVVLHSTRIKGRVHIYLYRHLESRAVALQPPVVFHPLTIPLLCPSLHIKLCPCLAHEWISSFCTGTQTHSDTADHLCVAALWRLNKLYPSGSAFHTRQHLKKTRASVRNAKCNLKEILLMRHCYC